jgi:AcrR family transcriptional regulator
MSSASDVRDSERATALPAATRMGPKPALTLERIADAAVAIADAEGIAAVSMQRVAAEFDYTKMSLYRYFASKDELVAAMIDRAVGEPPALDAVPGWRPRLEAWTGLLAETWQCHPWLPAATMGDRAMGPNEIGWIERAIGTLADTLLEPSEQMAVVLLICGHIRNTQSAATAGTQPWSGGRQRELVHVHGDEFPALERVLDGPADETSDLGRAFGLECILSGVEAILAERRARRSTG